MAAIAAGCASSSGVKNPSGVPVTEMKADERGFVAGTGIESQDIVTVADKMARAIVGVPEIANAPVALKALDKNGDGKLTGEEFRPARGQGGGRGPGGDRPAAGGAAPAPK